MREHVGRPHLPALLLHRWPGGSRPGLAHCDHIMAVCLPDRAVPQRYRHQRPHRARRGVLPHLAHPGCKDRGRGGVRVLHRSDPPLGARGAGRDGDAARGRALARLHRVDPPHRPGRPLLAGRDGVDGHQVRVEARRRLRHRGRPDPPLLLHRPGHGAQKRQHLPRGRGHQLADLQGQLGAGIRRRGRVLRRARGLLPVLHGHPLRHGPVPKPQGPVQVDPPRYPGGHQPLPLPLPLDDGHVGRGGRPGVPQERPRGGVQLLPSPGGRAPPAGGRGGKLREHPRGYRSAHGDRGADRHHHRLHLPGSAVPGHGAQDPAGHRLGRGRPLPRAVRQGDGGGEGAAPRPRRYHRLRRSLRDDRLAGPRGTPPLNLLPGVLLRAQRLHVRPRHPQGALVAAHVAVLPLVHGPHGHIPHHHHDVPHPVVLRARRHRHARQPLRLHPPQERAGRLGHRARRPPAADGGAVASLAARRAELRGQLAATAASAAQAQEDWREEELEGPEGVARGHPAAGGVLEERAGAVRGRQHRGGLPGAGRAGGRKAQAVARGGPRPRGRLRVHARHRGADVPHGQDLRPAGVRARRARAQLPRGGVPGEVGPAGARGGRRHPGGDPRRVQGRAEEYGPGPRPGLLPLAVRPPLREHRRVVDHARRRAPPPPRAPPAAAPYVGGLPPPRAYRGGRRGQLHPHQTEPREAAGAGAHRWRGGGGGAERGGPGRVHLRLDRPCGGGAAIQEQPPPAQGGRGEHPAAGHPPAPKHVRY
mmetsp:Transcript_47705/g.152914  ORF Transcript_47705/g.152914 Transcript_47705/m.152914 type:complete len:758 (+) Transcript_47705:458-2731(+)